MTITTKFNANDKVFFLKGSKIESGRVHSIRIEIDHTEKISTSYFLKKEDVEYVELNLIDESECFESKVSLIDQL